MKYKIVVDSCCELPEDMKKDPRFEIVPLTLIVGDKYEKEDNMAFDQREFLDAVAACPECPKSACPSPERYRAAYQTEAERVYVVTLSSKLSGSYNSAVLGKNLYCEKYGEKDICVVDSKSAACGETQIVYKIMELEEQEFTFAEITEQIALFVREMNTYFVLENLDTLRKNGRLSGVKALVASTLNIKPVMGADDGSIIQLGQGIGMKKALAKMAETAVSQAVEAGKKRLMITHCNNLKAAECVRRHIEEKLHFKETLILDAAGVSSMYANEGGVIVTI
ncbi:MAG: DegV family protein [Lachnospiraceae bacterium]|nr:DegV family protein [Lachnospiraceae bacterium]MDE7030700.1 DegV family protein [Lachnospiraceae bacterium]